MSTSTGSDDELVGGGPVERLDEDMTTRVTRGVVDGFTEASDAFSHELEGSRRVPELMGRSVAGIIRANSRLLDELATLVRQMTDDLAMRPRAPVGDELDYERLADLVATRLGATEPRPGAAERAKPEGPSRKA